MKLKDFPLLMEGMRQIMLDQYMKGAHIKTEEEVSDYWEPQFKIAEEGLTKLEGKTVEQVSPRLPEMPGCEDMELDAQSIEYFYLPVNDSDVWLADVAGLKPTEFWYAKLILEQFFDGVLRNTFQGDSDAK